MSDAVLQSSMVHLASVLCARDLRLCSAESCSGGWFAKICTDLPGSSRWFEGGFVTYSDAAKQQLLAVPAATLRRCSAVSEDVVAAMLGGALQRLPTASVAVAVSGIAGPEGGTAVKPVGLVCFGWQLRGRSMRLQRARYVGNREAVRRQTVQNMLAGTLQLLTG